jgi:hypothetical protein
MTKQEARDIATVLIAKTAICFDGTAFDECNPALTETEMDKIIAEIENISEGMIARIEKKLSISFDYTNSSHEIIDIILYE